MSSKTQTIYDEKKISNRDKKIIRKYYDITSIYDYSRLVEHITGYVITREDLYRFLYRTTDKKIFDPSIRIPESYPTDREIFWMGYSKKNQERECKERMKRKRCL